MASKENQGALNNLVYFADPFDQDEFNRVERWKNTLQKAIDEREELKNELCLHCGKYKNEHLGACNGCKWYE